MSKMFNYETDHIHDMVHPNLLTDTTHYVPECKDIILTETIPNYPKLTDYESEWLYFYENIYQGGGNPVDLEYQTLEFDHHAIVHNAIPFNYKRTIFKGKSIKNYKNNLFDNVLEKGAISISTGIPNDSNLKCYRSANFIPINGKFKIAKYGVSGDVHVCFYDSNKSFISNKTYVIRAVTEGNATVTPPTNSSFIKFYNPYDANEPTGEFGFGVMAENEMIELEIQSVKMPVLYTIGSNIFDSSKVKDLDSTWKEPFEPTTQLIRCNPNTKYYYNGKSFDYISLYDENKNNISSITVWHTEGIKSFTTTSNCFFLGFKARKNAFDSINEHFISTNNYYEPYQSNSLTVNEDVTLRGIGEVQDTLDLMTGELTEKIGEVVLDGSEGWKLSTTKDNTQVFNLSANNPKLKNIPKNGLLMCDKLKVASGVDDEIISFTSALYISILKSKVSTVEDLKMYLSQNPITFIHKLATESVKTVDLNAPLSKPYEGTNHYYTSSDTIPPSCELSVPVESTGAKNLNDISQED